MVKVAQFADYDIWYDATRRRFILTDQEGNEVASGESQTAVEEKASRLRKEGFKRISIIRVENDGEVIKGELTSINRDEQSAWVSMEVPDKAYGSGRHKVTLRYISNYYEATESNLTVAEAIKEKHKVIEQTLEEIRLLRATMVNRIDLDYFGLGSKR